MQVVIYFWVYDWLARNAGSAISETCMMRWWYSWHGDQAGNTAFSWHDQEDLATVVPSEENKPLSCLCALSAAAGLHGGLGRKQAGQQRGLHMRRGVIWEGRSGSESITVQHLQKESSEVLGRSNSWQVTMAGLRHPSGGNHTTQSLWLMGKVISNPERLLSAWVYHVDNKHSINKFWCTL